ncbi:MAG: RNA-binding protein [Leptospiraceae bacterium]|nr:RNA-binding protein [Leptospiraceae bacterium]MCP5496848.1 RNA-binding protein [Leptospiraceae bacterium]
MNIYVGNLSHSTTEDTLSKSFGVYGAVESVKIITDKYSGQPRGFAFVEMANKSESRKAIQELNETELDGRQIKVNEAKPRENRRDFNSGGGGSGGGGHRRNNNRW